MASPIGSHLQDMADSKTSQLTVF